MRKKLAKLDGALLVDSQDIRPINDEFKTDYDGFIVDPDYGVWGFYGIPYN